MKNSLLLLIFLCAFSKLSAQTSETKPEEKKNHNMALEFSAGYSLPFGNYAAIDSANEKSGYAKSGFQVQIALDWMGKSDFGLAVQYTFQRNPLKDTAAFFIPTDRNAPLGTGSWTNHCLMGGPVFMKTLKKVYLDAKILGGIILSSGTNFNTPDPTDTTGIRYSRNTGTGFVYQISAGVGLKVSANLALKFNLSLLGGWPEAKKQYKPQIIRYEKHIDPITGFTYQEAVYSAPVDYSIKKVISTVNPSIGLVYRF